MSEPIYDALVLQALDFAPTFVCEVHDGGEPCGGKAVALLVNPCGCGLERVACQRHVNAEMVRWQHFRIQGARRKCAGCNAPVTYVRFMPLEVLS